MTYAALRDLRQRMWPGLANSGGAHPAAAIEQPFMMGIADRSRTVMVMIGAIGVIVRMLHNHMAGRAGIGIHGHGRVIPAGCRRMHGREAS